MEPIRPGKKEMPNFDHLNDRVIAEKPSQPIFVLKTNLDPEDSTEENPYYQHKESKNSKAFHEYFEK